MSEQNTARQLEIIEAAGKILTNAGVSGLTTKNLAREMGFSEAAIYRHFSSKEKVIIAMLEYIAASMDELYVIAMDNDEIPDKKLKILFQNQFSFFGSNPHYVVAVFGDGLFEETDLIHQAILKIMAIKMKHLRPIIVNGQKKGVFTNEVTTDNLMHIIMGSVRLQMYKWRVANFQFEIEKEGNKIIDSLLKLIKL